MQRIDMAIYSRVQFIAGATLIEVVFHCVDSNARDFRRLVVSLFASILFSLTGTFVGAKELRAESDGRNINNTRDSEFDEPNDSGDVSGNLEIPNAEENKEWWQRMLRGEVGKDRFLILCALKDGNWKKLGDIRDFIEFQDHKNLRAPKLQEMLIRMAGRQLAWSSYRAGMKLKVGEGWLEKNPAAMSWGIESEWRIPTNVLPFLNILLMGCPNDNRCE